MYVLEQNQTCKLYNKYEIIKKTYKNLFTYLNKREHVSIIIETRNVTC